MSAAANSRTLAILVLAGVAMMVGLDLAGVSPEISELLTNVVLLVAVLLLAGAQMPKMPTQDVTRPSVR